MKSSNNGELPLVSVIVPVYNAEKYLFQCISSLINQTYKNIEIIIVDDGSTDESLSIINSFAKKDDRIKVIHKKNGGVSSARNAALKIFKGDYVSFVDADDYVELNYIELMLEKALKTNADIVRCDYDINGNFADVSNEDYFICSDKNYNIINDKTIVSYVHHSLYFQKILFDNKNNLILFDETLDVGEDLVYNTCLTLNAKSYYYLPKTLYHKINVENSLSNTPKPDFYINYINSNKINAIIIAKHNQGEGLICAKKRYYLALKNTYINLKREQKKNKIYGTCIKTVKKEVRKNLFDIFRQKFGLRLNLFFIKIAL